MQTGAPTEARSVENMAATKDNSPAAGKACLMVAAMVEMMDNRSAVVKEY